MSADDFQEGYDLALTEASVEDLSDCPYFNGTGTCSYGCWDEPQCQTCCPSDGWPTQRHPIVVALTARVAQLEAWFAEAEELLETGEKP